MQIQQVDPILENLFWPFRFSASLPNFSHANKLKHGGFPGKMTKKKKKEVIQRGDLADDWRVEKLTMFVCKGKS